VPDGRVLYAGMSLLDRQLVDRSGRPCGNVDDCELEEGPTGALHVSAVLAGPGVLATRLGWRRLGPWLEWVGALVFPSPVDRPQRIPFSRVSDVGSAVHLAVDADELATMAGERWVRDHVIRHIPGNGHDAAE